MSRPSRLAILSVYFLASISTSQTYESLSSELPIGRMNSISACAVPLKGANLGPCTCGRGRGSAEDIVAATVNREKQKGRE
jgi:hypothetical protein